MKNFVKNFLYTIFCPIYRKKTHEELMYSVRIKFSETALKAKRMRSVAVKICMNNLVRQ